MIHDWNQYYGQLQQTHLQDDVRGARVSEAANQELKKPPKERFFYDAGCGTQFFDTHRTGFSLGEKYWSWKIRKRPWKSDPWFETNVRIERQLSSKIVWSDQTLQRHHTTSDQERLPIHCSSCLWLNMARRNRNGTMLCTHSSRNVSILWMPGNCK